MAGRGGVEGPVERPEGGAEAGEGLPASAATRAPPGNVDEGTSLPVRGGEGSGGLRRRGGGGGFGGWGRGAGGVGEGSHVWGGLAGGAEGPAPAPRGPLLLLAGGAC